MLVNPFLRSTNKFLVFVFFSVADPWHFGVDPDPDPRIHASNWWIRIRIRILDPDLAIFDIELQDASKKLIFLHNIFWLLLFEATFTPFFKDKKSKKSQNSRNQGFSYYFCMMIEGSGSRAGSGSGSKHVTSGSGSGSRRPKNTWIRWIRIRIRIRNTGFF